MTSSHFEWPSKIDRAISAGFEPGEAYGGQPVDPHAPLPAHMVQRIHQGSIEGCDNCGEQCQECDDRLCATWGPAPRPCATTCEDCPCDCRKCLDQREDMRDELLSQLERESR